MTSWEFTADDPIKAEIKLPAGQVKAAATAAQAVTVSLLPEHGAASKAAEKLIADTEVSFDGGTLTVEVPHRVHVRGDAPLDLAVELPEGSSVAVNTASADVSCAGELGSLQGRTASGDVTADRVGRADLTTASGDVRLREVTGDTLLQTASGDAVIQRASGDITAKTASGDLIIGHAAHSVQAQAASGDVTIDRVTTGTVDVTSVSGDVCVGVAPGIGIYLDLSSLSGRVRSELDADEQGGSDGEPGLTLRCNSVSGAIKITRANPDR
jgi:hypothetical protein